MNIRELLTIYYQRFSKKDGWQDVIHEDFRFIGGDMTKPEPIIGKQAYVNIIERFSENFTGMHPVQMYFSDRGAFVLASYDYLFPNGTLLNGNVAELWTEQDGKLSSLTIFFDTENFQKLIQGNRK